MDTPIQVDLGRIAQDLQIRRVQVESVVQLLDEGNTVPFITRYRKERTGNLNEVVIREIQVRVGRLRELADRKQTILKTIEAQGKLTEELAAAIRGADNPKRLEDLYLPYKPKKRTKAAEAREKGIEPLALRIWTRDETLTDLNAAAAEFINAEKELESTDKVLEGVRYILAEAISEMATVRDAVRRVVWKTGKIVTSKSEIPEGEGLEYRDYFNYSEPVGHIPPHRVLAINRGDKEGPLKVKLEVARNEVEQSTMDQLPLEGHPQGDFFRTAAVDAIDRLLMPSMEREVRRDLTEMAERHAVEVFARNLRSLVLQPPIPKQVVMAIDPGFRTGCKVAVLDPNGNLLEHAVIHPHPPQNRRSEAKQLLKDLVGKHGVGVVAIGNGTACRETEELIAEIIAEGTHFNQNPEAARAAAESAPAAEPPPAEAPAPPEPEPAAPAPAEHDSVAEASAHAEPEGHASAPSTDELVAPAEQDTPQNGAPDETPEATESSPSADPAPISGGAPDEWLPPISGGAPDETPTAEVDSPASPASDLPPTPTAETSASADSETPAESSQEASPEPTAHEPAPEPVAASAEPPANQADPQSEPVEATAEPAAEQAEPPAADKAPEAAAAPESAEGAAETPAPAPGPAPATPPVSRSGGKHGGKSDHQPRQPKPKAPPAPPRPHPADAQLAQLAYVIVNEAGASVYSTSSVGREEFPDFDATLRGTISIGRRLEDPLAELVKIEPQNIGVGLYQHDVNVKQLKESLESVISSCVNFVGVDLNTASVPLLRHVSGLNQLTARRIVDYRKEKGPFSNREQLLQVEGIGPATYTQAAGFLKIREGDNPFDGTWVHPESYAVATRLLEKLEAAPDVVRHKDQLPALRTKLTEADLPALSRELEVGEPTLRDICEALARPERDPRDDLPKPIFKKGVLKLEDLTPGMELKGTVLNVVDFGAFVDIGLKDSGLVHISQLANRYIKSPHDVVSVGDVVTAWVMGVDQERKRVSLTMVKPGTERTRGAQASGRRGGGGGEPREARSADRRGGPGGGAPRGARRDVPPSQLTGLPVGAPATPQGEAARPERPAGGPRPDRGPGGGGPRQGAGPGRGGPRPPYGQGAPGRPQAPRPAPRPSKPSPPPPPLSKDALSGTVPLRTFGQLKQLWQAREAEPEGGEGEAIPPQTPDSPPAPETPPAEGGGGE
jgi:uncharacterized protein